MNDIVPDSIRDPRISTRTIYANGYEFEVDVCGDGDRLALCLHGFPEHSISWRHQLPMLADEGFTAWAPNLRGYGHSARPDSMSAYAIEDLMADVAGLIDAFQQSRPGAAGTVLIAHDWGAVIAWYFAMRQIRPLEKLIICNVPHPGAMSSGGFSWEQLKRSWYIFFFQIPRLPERLLGRDGARGIGEMIRNSACNPEQFPDEIIDVYSRNAAQPGALTAMVNYYRALVRGGGARRQQQQGFPMIRVPTLMVWGEDDVALTKETTYGTDAFVDQLTIRYLPRVSHWVQQDAPDEVNAMIRAFLENRPVPELRWQPVLSDPD
jgi:pimeloyl-ACP methyl ester carboxylesterase